ncbi:hypothetical protein D3C73_1254080 [compost metagenome]
MSARADSNCAASSLPSLTIWPLRSPSAIRRAALNAWLIGAVMLRVNAQASSRVASRAMTMMTPTIHNARSYIAAAALAASSAPCWLKLINASRAWSTLPPCGASSSLSRVKARSSWPASMCVVSWSRMDRYLPTSIFTLSSIARSWSVDSDAL